MASATGYSAGRVYLQVVPSYRNFLSALRRDARGPLGKAIADTFETQLGKAGYESGDAFGKNLTKGVAKSVKVDALTAQLNKKLKKAFDEAGGDASRYGARLRDLQGDIERSGKVEDQHIKRLKGLAAEMYRASDATKDSATKQRLLNSARTLDREGISAYTKELANLERAHAAEGRAAASAAKAAERAAESDKRRNRSTRDSTKTTNVAARSVMRLSDRLQGIGPDAATGANGFRFFSGAVLAVSSVGAGLVPLLAVMAGGIASFLPILGALGVAGGVAALGLSGLSGAVEALGKQQDATKGSSAAYQRSLVQAGRAVADARRGLANAYRTSSRSIRDAIERERDAERSLADAKRDAAEAQRDVTEARKEAKEEQADLANQVAQNQLDERQGVLDLFNAYNEYGAVMADGGSTNLEREQADLALKQAQLNLKIIREEQKKLAAEKKKSDKDGINGSKNVKNAEDRLRDSLERVKEAQDDLKKSTRDLAETRGDAARSIEDAQRSLTRAQEDYNDALKGSATAIDDVNDAMSKLGPEGERFARFIFSLKDGFEDLRRRVQAGFLPGLEDGMRRIMDTYGPGFTQFLTDMGVILGDLSRDAGEAFSNPAFQSFFSAFGEFTKVVTKDFGAAMLNWFEGLANVFTIILPDAEALSGWMTDLSETFKNWTASSEGQKSLTDFFGYIREIAPEVKDFFGALGGALANVAKALAPIGETILNALTGLFEKIAAMDPNTLTVLIGGFAAIVVALQAVSALIGPLAVIIPLLLNPWLLLIVAVVAIGAAFFFLKDTNTSLGKSLRKLMKDLEPLFKFFKDVGRELKERFIKLWEERLLPMFKRLSDRVQKDLIPAINSFLPALRPVMSWMIDVFFKGLENAFNIIEAILDGLIDVFIGIIEFLEGVFTGDWEKALNGIKKIFKGFRTALKGIIKGVFTAFRNVIKAGMDVVKELFRKPINWVIDKFTSLKDNALEALDGLWEGIKDVMGKIGEALKKPIVGFLDLVINDGLVDGVRTIQGWIGTKEKNKLKHLGGFGGKYADGGVLPGYTPGRDPHKFYSPTGGKLELSGGEAIMRPEWTRAVGGKGAVARMNSLARRGMAFAKGGVFWPTTTKQLSPDYPGHTGVDISGPGIYGKPVYAAHTGVVTATPRWTSSYGNHVRMRGTDGIETIYGHLSRIATTVGAAVKGGKQIGNVGSTGNSTGPHLHFEVRPGGTRGAALNYLRTGKLLSRGDLFSGNPITDKLADLSKGAIKALKDPGGFIATRVSRGFDKLNGIGGGALDMLKGIPAKMLGSMTKKLKRMAKNALGVPAKWFKSDPAAVKNLMDNLRGSARGGRGPLPKLYDQGGYLPPGMSTVFNATGKPEPVFSPDQWDKISAGGGIGGDSWDIKAYGADPQVVARELFAKINRQQRMAKRSGTLGRRGA